MELLYSPIFSQPPVHPPIPPIENGGGCLHVPLEAPWPPPHLGNPALRAWTMWEQRSWADVHATRLPWYQLFIHVHPPIWIYGYHWYHCGIRDQPIHPIPRLCINDSQFGAVRPSSRLKSHENSWPSGLPELHPASQHGRLLSTTLPAPRDLDSSVLGINVTWVTVGSQEMPRTTGHVHTICVHTCAFACALAHVSLLKSNLLICHVYIFIYIHQNPCVPVSIDHAGPHISYSPPAGCSFPLHDSHFPTSRGVPSPVPAAKVEGSALT